MSPYPGHRTSAHACYTILVYPIDSANLAVCTCCTYLYLSQVVQLAFLVACMYTAIGVLRLGFIVRFLSHSVITGFTSGAAIIIGMSQV